MSAFEIAQLWTYPVKSLGGFRVRSAVIMLGGSFAGDREWLIVDLSGQMLWQGNLPRMALLTAALDHSDLSIVQPDGSVMTCPADHGGDTVLVTQYGITFKGIDAGLTVAEWLSTFLDHPVRLVRIGDQAHFWPKLNPLHLISLHSLTVLNDRMRAIGGPSIDVERLRPNIVLAGTHAPFEEERVPNLRFHETEIHLIEPCIRCELPNISRIDASREKQPLKLIGKMSKERPTSKPASFT